MLKVLLLAAVFTATSLSHAADPYPSRPVRVIVPYAAGGGSDFSARLIANALSQELGQPFIVENRPGAGGTIADALVAKAPADGYTLILLDSSFSIRAAAFKNVSYSYKDFTPITQAIGIPQAFVVPSSLQVDSVKAFVDLARAQPGKLNYGSAGMGTTNHVYVELLKLDEKLNLVHVPYGGGAASMNGLVTAQVQMIFSTLPTVAGFVKGGQVRALAVATGSGKRASAFPDVPTMTEAGFPELDVMLWYGFGGPAGMPSEVVERLSAAIQKVLDTSAVKEGIAKQGSEPIKGVTPQRFMKNIDSEVAQWRKVVDAARISLQ